MKTFSVITEAGLGTDAHMSADANSGKELVGGDNIAVSEKAKRQIGSQASEEKTPANFVEGFPEFGDGPT